MVARTVTCKLCGRDWLLDHHVGRPREYCYDCQPEGWLIVKADERTKLRRDIRNRYATPTNQWTEI